MVGGTQKAGIVICDVIALYLDESGKRLAKADATRPGNPVEDVGEIHEDVVKVVGLLVAALSKIPIPKEDRIFVRNRLQVIQQHAVWQRIFRWGWKGWETRSLEEWEKANAQLTAIWGEA